MAIVIEIADAVVDLLNETTFDQGFTAERRYLPIFELPDMKVLHVTVVPKSKTDVLFARSSAAHEVQADVAVQKKFASEDAVELDPLLKLVEDIADLFRLKTLNASRPATWIKT